MDFFWTLILVCLARKLQDFLSKMCEICFYSVKIMSGIFKNLGRKKSEKAWNLLYRILQTHAMMDPADTLLWRHQTGLYSLCLVTPSTMSTVQLHNITVLFGFFWKWTKIKISQVFGGLRYILLTESYCDNE